MKRKIIFFLASLCCLAIAGCNKSTTSSKVLTVGTSADYPPFEYIENGTLKGFDIDLGNLIGKEMGYKVVFQDMQFSTILPEIESNYVDAGISTITDTKEREKSFDFSKNYYTESIAIVYPTGKPIKTQSELANKKIACQLGTTMQYWLETHSKSTDIFRMDNSNQEIENLKAGYVDGVLIDQVQASVFCQKNKGLSYAVISKSDTGYAVALKKGNPLKSKINDALVKLEKDGSLAKLEQKWFSGSQDL